MLSSRLHQSGYEGKPNSSSDDSPAIDLKGLGERLKAIRAQAGLSQTKMASALGFSRRSLIAWEAGEAEPSIRLLMSLRHQFDIDPEWLLSGRDLDPKRSFSAIDWEAYDRIEGKLRGLLKRVPIELDDRQVIDLARIIFEDGSERDELDKKAIVKRLLAVTRKS